MIRAVLVEDHRIVRQGLKRLMESTSQIEVVASAETAADGLRITKQFSPDVGIFDLGLPDHSGLWLINKVRGVLPDMPILVLSMHSEVEIVASVLRAGANGYLDKSTDADTLLGALRELVGGGTFLTDAMRERLDGLDTTKAPTVLRPRFNHASETMLDAKELRVLNLAAQGMNNSEISKSLDISVGTVKARLSAAYQKLGVESRTEAVAAAINLGIVASDA